MVEVYDLSFLRDRNIKYSWLKRHFRHHRLRFKLKRAEKIVAENPEVARDLTRYYFVPKERKNIK